MADDVLGGLFRGNKWAFAVFLILILLLFSN